MEGSKKLLRYLIGGIFISLIISVVMINILKIKDPVFIKHYRELGIVENEEGVIFDGSQIIELPYIVDIDDKREIVDIDIKDYPELSFSISNYFEPHSMNSYLWWNRNNLENNIRYGQYIVKVAYLRFHETNFSSSYEFEDIVLSDATIVFNNGDTLDIDLGQIIISKEEDKYADFIEWRGISTRNDGSSILTLITLKDFEIVDIESKLDINDDIYEVNIDRLAMPDSNDLIYEENDYVYIQTKFNNTDSIVEKYSLYNISPKITIKDEVGNIYYYRVDNLFNYNMYFNDLDIYKYLKARGAI